MAESTSMENPLAGTERTRIRRSPTRSVKERESLHQIIDETMICHVGFVHEGQPFVIPTLGWRESNTLYIHGSRGSRMLKVLKDGAEACITFTLLDGLVMARSAFHHSANYRSAMILGCPKILESKTEKLAALEIFMELIAPARWDKLRETNSQEIEATDVLQLDMNEASVKIRSGDPIDDDEDMQHPVWAGVIPVKQVFGPMVAAEDCLASESAPDYSDAFEDRWSDI
jgi:nitroimidazol reductase NimA-like FMN-containing flavoprotein (pyridoxamine 5'-phosphate oxidase superfamily)